MAAKTQGEILDLVHAHTGRTSATVEEAACNAALKLAQMKHAFKDAQDEPSDYAITEDTTFVTVAPSTTITSIITARIVEADGSRNKLLPLKTRTWWDERVINPEDNMKGWPQHGLKWGTKVILDRPAMSGLELRLRVAYEQIFTSDGSTGISTCVCPIHVLDKFVEDYVTAEVFKSVRSWDSYKAWRISALGMRWESEGKPGGELLNAIQADSVRDTALDISASEPHPAGAGGVAVENVIDGHDDIGNVRWWN